MKMTKKMASRTTFNMNNDNDIKKLHLTDRTKLAENTPTTFRISSPILPM